MVSLAWLWFLLRRYESREDSALYAPNGFSQGRLVLVVALLWLGYLTVVNRLAPGIGLDEAQDGFLQKLWTVVFTVAALPSGFIQNTALAIRGGITLLILSICLLVVAPGNAMIQAILMGAGGVGWALVTVNTLPLLINAGPQGKNGRNTGLYYLAFALAGLVTPWLMRSVAPMLGPSTIWLAPLFWGVAWLIIRRDPSHGHAGGSGGDF
jgi:hypothetical protein